MVSSDWNQCLAPCGPFDPIIYNYPELKDELTSIFKEYTGNLISLGTANQKIQKLLPTRLSVEQMDAYLDDSFVTYKNVPELIDWCLQNDIMFMINTTGLMGYFQRVFAKKLLPKVPVISASRMITFPELKTDPPYMYDLKEIQEKGKNTKRAVHSFDISEKKILIIGDSGGDGPHFEWGKNHNAYLIGSMTKPSLFRYCNKKKIEIDLFWGPDYSMNDNRNRENEMLVDFMELRCFIQGILNQ